MWSTCPGAACPGAALDAIGHHLPRLWGYCQARGALLPALWQAAAGCTRSTIHTIPCPRSDARHPARDATGRRSTARLCYPSACSSTLHSPGCQAKSAGLDMVGWGRCCIYLYRRRGHRCRRVRPTTRRAWRRTHRAPAAYCDAGRGGSGAAPNARGGDNAGRGPRNRSPH